MGRMYTGVFGSSDLSAPIELFTLAPPTNAIVVIHEIHITQALLEISEQMCMALYRALPTVTPPTGGTVVPIAKVGGMLDASASSVVKREHTSFMSSSTQKDLLRQSNENILNGWHWVFTPEARIVVPPTTLFACDLESSPSTPMSFNVEVVFEEIG